TIPQATLSISGLKIFLCIIPWKRNNGITIMMVKILVKNLNRGCPNLLFLYCVFGVFGVKFESCHSDSVITGIPEDRGCSFSV
ncbi:MAG: hypothetical protein K6E49_09130, partial [Lachnospiraceae bacterium]|nr:hypothetical protein [Lachnospiraceae bacterium]